MSDKKRTKKRAYNMSKKARAQRQAASVEANKNKTGPTTEEGKAISARNSWKHGEYSEKIKGPVWHKAMMGAKGKPCRTTCSKYPCSLVDDEQTRAGQNCLDKTVFVEAFDSIITTLQNNDVESVHGLLAAQLAGAVEMLQGLRDEVAGRGYMIGVPMVNKEGEIIYDKSGNEVLDKLVLNPAIPHYNKLLDSLGINFAELMATPRAISKVNDDDGAVDAVADLFGRVLNRAAGGGPVRRVRVIDSEAVRG